MIMFFIGHVSVGKFFPCWRRNDRQRRIVHGRRAKHDECRIPNPDLDVGRRIGFVVGRAHGGRKPKGIMMLRVTSLRLAGAALLFAAAAPALAAPPQQAQAAGAPSDQANETNAAPTEAAKPKTAAKPEEHKICRMVNGSEARLGAQKVCMTAEQWKRADF
jgi:hypothetical protein